MNLHRDLSGDGMSWRKNLRPSTPVLSTPEFDTIRPNEQHDAHHLTMRLSKQAQQIIRATVREIFGSEATVRLFGSRIDDMARGGDIDLLVELPEVTADTERKTLRLIARLQMRLGDQPIDVLVLDPSTPRQAIHEQATRTGIML